MRAFFLISSMSNAPAEPLFSPSINALRIYKRESKAVLLCGLLKELGNTMDKAREILQAHQYFELNETDWQSFMSALENPPEPNNYLKTAWDYSHEEHKGLDLLAELQSGVDE